MIQHRLRLWGSFAVIVMVATLAAAEETVVPQAAAMPDGLESYLEARILEANEDWGDAEE